MENSIQTKRSLSSVFIAPTKNFLGVGNIKPRSVEVIQKNNRFQLED